MQHLSRLQKFKSMFAIFLTFAIDYLGATIIFPIFAPLFLSHANSIFTRDPSDFTRSILLGIFLASFPLAQFAFSPIIGEMADRKGRKRSFLMTILLVIIGYFLSGWAIETRHLTILFIGRFIMGAAAGNMSVCLAAIIDLSETAKQKMRYFSIGSVIAGVAFVVGPFLGGKLADPSLSPLFNPAFPLQVGGYLAIINFFVILFLFHETLHEKAHAPFDFLAAIHNVKEALKTPSIKNLYIAYLFYFFGWNMVFQFVPALLVDVFKSSFSIIGNVSSVMGLVWIIGTIIISTLMHYKVCPKWSLYLSLIGFAIVSPFIGFQTSMIALLTFVGISVLLAGGMWPIFASSISGAAEKHMQGKIMGLSQSMQSLAMVIAPLLGGAFIRVHPSIPFILSAVASILSLLMILPIKLQFENK